MLQRAKELAARFDDAVELHIDRVRGHRTVDRVMYGASELGDWSLIWHLIGSGQALLPGRSPASAVRLSAFLGVESVVVNMGVKRLFRRRRPVWQGVDPRPHRLRTPRTSSFPSGHASSAFTAAGILAARGDPLWPLYYGVAAVVATSRVYVRIHHPTDVVAGALLGAGMAAVANKVWAS
ncbi:MAG: phosphatase PAP2 family protein [Acidimicrobiales bacterium]|nr:phosphatase PAP2 family protein [Acidimicrobiales bacterium]